MTSYLLEEKGGAPARSIDSLCLCCQLSFRQHSSIHEGQERADVLRELGLDTAATWGLFQPNNPHEFVVPFSKPHRKSYRAGAERTFRVLSPLEQLDKGSI